MKRLVVITSTAALVAAGAGLAAAAPVPTHTPTANGQQICLVLSHDPQGQSTDDLCIVL